MVGLPAGPRGAPPPPAGAGRPGEAELAWSAYRRAIGGNPQHLGAQAALAQVLVRLGRTEDAIGQYRRLLAKTDSGREAWLAYAKLLVSRERALPAGSRQWPEV